MDFQCVCFLQCPLPETRNPVRLILRSMLQWRRSTYERQTGSTMSCPGSLMESSTGGQWYLTQRARLRRPLTSEVRPQLSTVPADRAAVIDEGGGARDDRSGQLPAALQVSDVRP